MKRYFFFFLFSIEVVSMCFLFLVFNVLLIYINDEYNEFNYVGDYKCL